MRKRIYAAHAGSFGVIDAIGFVFVFLAVAVVVSLANPMRCSIKATDAASRSTSFASSRANAWLEAWTADESTVAIVWESDGQSGASEFTSPPHVKRFALGRLHAGLYTFALATSTGCRATWRLEVVE